MKVMSLLLKYYLMPLYHLFSLSGEPEVIWMHYLLKEIWILLFRINWIPSYLASITLPCYQLIRLSLLVILFFNVDTLWVSTRNNCPLLRESRSPRSESSTLLDSVANLYFHFSHTYHDLRFNLLITTASGVVTST